MDITEVIILLFLINKFGLLFYFDKIRVYIGYELQA